MLVTAPYKLVSREFHEQDTLVDVSGVKVGGDRFIIMAGPWAGESAEPIDTIGAGLRERGAPILRGGAFKPRTSPYSFQGLGEQGLQLLAEAGKRNHLPVVPEATANESRQLA